MILVLLAEGFIPVLLFVGMGFVKFAQVQLVLDQEGSCQSHWIILRPKQGLHCS